MPAIPIIGAVGSIAGGLFGASSAKKAADTQAAAANHAADLQHQDTQAALDFQKQQFGISQANMAPWLRVGQSGLSNLASLLGILPNEGTNTGINNSATGPRRGLIPWQDPSSLPAGPAPAAAPPGLSSTGGPNFPGSNSPPSPGGNPSAVPSSDNVVNPSGGPSSSPAAPQNLGLQTPGTSNLSSLATMGPESPSPLLAAGSGDGSGIGAGAGSPASSISGQGDPLALNPGAPPASPLTSNLGSLVNPSLGDSGSLLQPWQYEFVAPNSVTEQNDPGYQFRRDQGTQALNNSAAARGAALSGGTAKALDQYNQGFASNEYGNVYNRALTNYQTAYNQFQQGQANQFNRLAAISGVGQTAAGELNSAGVNAANNVSNLSLKGGEQIGNNLNNSAAARASGYVGANNAVQGSISNLTNLAQLLAFQRSQSPASGGGGGGGTPDYPTPDYNNLSFA